MSEPQINDSELQFKSQLASHQEELIPDKTITLNQNKKLIALWYEAKNLLDEQIKRQQYMTSADLIDSASLKSVGKYMLRMSRILGRWTNVSVNEEGQTVSALIMNQLFKNVTIKLDQVFRLKDKEVSDYKEKCDREIRKIKDQSKDQIELNEKKLEIEK